MSFVLSHSLFFPSHLISLSLPLCFLKQSIGPNAYVLQLSLLKHDQVPQLPKTPHLTKKKRNQSCWNYRPSIPHPTQPHALGLHTNHLIQSNPHHVYNPSNTYLGSLALHANSASCHAIPCHTIPLIAHPIYHSIHAIPSMPYHPCHAIPPPPPPPLSPNQKKKILLF